MVVPDPQPQKAVNLPDGLDARYRQLIARVEEQLHQATQYNDPQAQLYARHLLAAGGKRLRPLLTLLAAEFGDPSRPAVQDAAVGVELIHLASLYHDDVMDSAVLRRGAASAHTLWGNHAAILTGDLLFARASLILADLGAEAVRIQAQTFERLCLGQLRESIGPAPGDSPVEFYLRVLRDKTASLIATAARYGAMFAGTPDEVVRAVTAYGEQLGIAFQLADDVLDLSAEVELLGKTPGTDLRERVLTMPVLLLQERVASGAGTAADAAVLAALAGDLSDDAALAAAVMQLQDSDVLAATSALAANYAQAAADELAGLPDSPAKAALQLLAHAAVNRAA